MKARVEMITVRVMPMKMMFPHPSEFQRDMFFSIIRRQNRIKIGGENAEKHTVNVFKPQLLEMNCIHIINSSKCV